MIQYFSICQRKSSTPSQIPCWLSVIKENSLERMESCALLSLNVNKVSREFLWLIQIWISMESCTFVRNIWSLRHNKRILRISTEYCNFVRNIWSLRHNKQILNMSFRTLLLQHSKLVGTTLMKRVTFKKCLFCFYK